MRKSWYDMSYDGQQGRKAETRAMVLTRRHNRLKEMTKELIINNGLEISEELRKAIGLQKANKQWQAMKELRRIQEGY